MPAPRQAIELKITVSDRLYRRLTREAHRRDEDISTLIATLLEQQMPELDLTHTETWQLCGAFSVAQPDPAYVVRHSETGQAITNYAEHVNRALYLGK